MLVHRRVTPSIKFAGTQLYTWVERGTVRIKCLAQEHNTMSPTRDWNRIARSGDEHTNHEATAPPLVKWFYQITSLRAWSLVNEFINCIWLAEGSQELLDSQSTFIQIEISLKNEWLTFFKFTQIQPVLIFSNFAHPCSFLLFCASFYFFYRS